MSGHVFPLYNNKRAVIHIPKITTMASKKKKKKDLLKKIWYLTRSFFVVTLEYVRYHPTVDDHGIIIPYIICKSCKEKKKKKNLIHDN